MPVFIAVFATMAQMTQLDTIRVYASRGVRRREVEAIIRRKLTSAEMVEFTRIAALSRLKRQQDAANQSQSQSNGGASGAERKAASLARHYNVDEIPPVSNPMRRSHAERSALFFIRHYCTATRGGFLKKPVLI